MGAFPYYQRGLVTPARPARIRVGAEAPTMVSVAIGHGMAVLNQSPYQLVGFAVLRDQEDPEVFEAASEALLDDWYSTIVNRPDVVYAVTWTKPGGSPIPSPANIGKPANMLEEYRTDPGQGTASGKVTGKGQGEIVIKTPVDKSGGGGVGLALGIGAGLLFIGLIASKGKHEDSL